MGCITTYLTPDGITSNLYKNLVDRFGQIQGEAMYLNSKLYNWKSTDLNLQGEPEMETLLAGNFTSKQKRTATDVIDNLTSSEPNVDFIHTDEVHEYRVNGTLMESVSRRIDKHVPYTGSVTEYDYANEGNRTHSMFEKVIDGAKHSDIIDEFNPTEAEKALISQIQDVVSDLKNRAGVGGRIVSEIRMANTKKGVAGTIDILLVFPDGTGEIYDIKTAYQTPGRKAKGGSIWDIYATSQGIANYKAKRYALQTTYYKELAETSDAVTGRAGIEIKDVFVIPVEVRGEEGNWTKYTVKTPENINNWQSGTTNFAISATKIVQKDGVVNPNRDLTLEGRPDDSSIDAFVDKVIGKYETPAQTVNTKASTILSNYKDARAFRYNTVSYMWTSKIEEKRLDQIKQVMTGEDKSNDSSVAMHAVNTIMNEDRQGIFAKDDDAYDRLMQIYKMSAAVNVFALSDIEGYADRTDILVFQRKNGTIELVKMTMDNLTQKIPVTNSRRGNKPNTIVGNFLTYRQAKSKGITIENTMIGREKLKLSLIAMELKKTNPELKVDRILIASASYHVKTTPIHVPLSEIIPQIKEIYNISDIKEGTSGSLKETLDNEQSYIAEDYETDSVDELYNYFDSQLTVEDFINPETGKANSRQYIHQKLIKYINKEIQRDELAEFLRSREYGLRRIIASKYEGHSQGEIEESIQSDPEFILLSRAILTLEGMKLYPEQDITDYMFGKINQFIVSPTKTGMRTVDTAIDFGRKSVDTVKKIMHDYNNRKIPVLETLRIDAGGLNTGVKIGRGTINSNNLVGMGTDAFLPLIQTKQNADGTTYYTPFFIKEGTTAWSALSTAQQNTIRFFKQEIQDSFRKAHPDINKDGSFVQNWPEDMIPIVNSRPNDYLFKAKKAVGKGNIKGIGKNIKASFTRMRDLSMGQYEYRAPEKSNHRVKIYDFFKSQVDPTTGIATEAELAKMGLDSEMNLVDSGMNDTFQLDLDATVTSFVEHYEKKAEYDRVLPTLMMFRSIFKFYENAYFLNQKGGIMLLDTWIKDNFFGEKQITSPEIETNLNVAIGAAAFMMIGMNWKTFTLNGIQGYGQMVIRSITSSMRNDKQFPGIKSFHSAHNEMMKVMTDPSGKQGRFLSLLAEAYLPDNLINIKSKKYKPLQTGMLTSQTAFAMDRGIERSLRILYLVAQMKKDGTFDAHSLEETTDKYGNKTVKLIYNEHLDERFKKQPKLKNAIRKSLADKNEGIDKDGKMTLAYDWRLRQKYKHYSDLITPSSDKDLASAYRHYGLAGAISFMRSWARDYVVGATSKEYENETVGDWVVTDDGEYAWTSKTFKGMWRTYALIGEEFPRILKNRDISMLGEADRQHLVFTANSLIAWGILAMLSRILYMGDDKEDDTRKTMAYMFNRAMQDVLVPLNLNIVASMFDDPLLVVSYYKRLFNTTTSAMLDLTEGEFEDSMEKMGKITPIVKNLNF